MHAFPSFYRFGNAQNKDIAMKNRNYMFLSVLLFSGCNNLFAELNQFGISDIVPTHADDNNTFDQRIGEEMTDGNLTLKARRTESFTVQDILKFIQKINNDFENFLNNPDNQDPDALEDIKLAIIDVEKAKKMLRSQDVTPYQEHLLRAALGSINTKVNAYNHTDAIEGSSYIRQ